MYIFRVFHKRVGAKHLAVLLLVLQTSGFEPEKGNANNTNIVIAPYFTEITLGVRLS